MRDIVYKFQDMTDLEWKERVSSSGTAGTYLKARSGTGAHMRYYKLPRFNGIELDGHECVNELIASRLMRILGIEHAEYRLLHASVLIDGVVHETWLNSSRNFRKPGERKIALGTFYELFANEGESPYDLCLRFGWGNELAKMVLVDYLMANRDRHSSNIEVLTRDNTNFRLAPIFDTGFSLLAPMAGDLDWMLRFDPLKSVATTNFVGSRDLEANLRLVAPVEGIGELDYESRAELLSGLDAVLSDVVLDKIWEIIWRRWQRYEEIRAD